MQSRAFSATRLAGASFLCGICLSLGAIAAQPTEPFQLAMGETLHIGHVTVTALGGFRGYQKGEDQEGQSYSFVRDGSSKGEYALIVLDHGDASNEAIQRYKASRQGFAYALMGTRALNLIDQGWTVADSLEPDRKWTYGDTDFFYVTLEGHDKNEGLKVVLASATVGVDYVCLLLQSPTSMWPATFETLKQFAASIH